MRYGAKPEQRAAVVETIRLLSLRHGRPPAMHEIAEVLHMSTSNVHYHVHLLIKHGVLTQREGTRGLFIREQGHA